jgi:hypothetical protein
VQQPFRTLYPRVKDMDSVGFGMIHRETSYYV